MGKIIQYVLVGLVAVASLYVLFTVGLIIIAIGLVAGAVIYVIGYYKFRRSAKHFTHKGNNDNTHVVIDVEYKDISKHKKDE